MDFKDFEEFISVAQRLFYEGKEFVVCTVIESKGSSPQKAGSRMIITSDGESFGTVGGGIVESDTIEKANSMIKKKESVYVLHFELNESGKGVCGGSMSIFLEGFYSRRRVVIFGAGHVSEAVCDVLKRLNYRISVFDNRNERLDLPAFEGTDKICAEYSELDKYVAVSHDTDILVMTPNHEYDFLVVKKLLRENFGSLGLLGSKRKKAELVGFLKKEGFSEEEISKVRVPVGLEIGSRTPYEIAVSIAAELIRMRSDKK